MTMELIKPSLETLNRYVAALERGWSPDNVRGAAAAEEQLRKIRQDARAFVDGLDDPNALGEPIRLPDGGPSRGCRVSSAGCGMEISRAIGFRWQPGRSSLPAHLPGHVGYAVVHWKSGRGNATQALALLLPAMREQGLDYIEVTTEPDNLASQKVVLANGGRLIRRFPKPAAYGGSEALLFRIDREDFHSRWSEPN